MALSRARHAIAAMHAIADLRQFWYQRPAGLRFVLALLGSGLLLAGLVDLLDPALGWNTMDAMRKASPAVVVVLNALPALALLMVLIAITRRMPLAMWLTALVVIGLYTANSAKLEQLQTPLLPADLRLLADPGPAVALLGHYLKLNANAIAMMVVGVVITIILLRRRSMPRLIGWRRLVLFAGAVLMAVSMVAGTAPWRRLYNAQWLGFEPWALTESAGRAGLIGSLLLYHWELGDGLVPGADHDAALALLTAHAPLLRERLAAVGGADERPDIIIVQSESLFDPGLLNEVSSASFLPQFQRVARDAHSGNLRVPTFGGGTIRTEFEVLTGAPLASLGGIQYPWLELDHARLPNITSVLARNGYQTTAIHPNGAAFWNRNRAFPELGFNRFIDVESFSKDDIVGLFTSDKAMTDRLLDELKDDDGPPQFIFAISMENHGPFDWRPGLNEQRLAALPMPDKLDAGGRYWFGNYLYLLEDADHELGRLAEALQQRKRRSLLLFFGDHLPALHTVYHQLGFRDGRTELDQPTPWLMLDSANPARVHSDTQSWLLPGQLLATADIRDEPYFIVIAALSEALNVGREALDEDQAAAFTALAQLQLRGELEPVLNEALGITP